VNLPLSWLKDYVDITLPVEDLADRLTLAGLEVSGIERIGDWWDRERIVVGQVLEVRPHPNADRLTLPLVEYGGAEPIQVVTGAPNIRVGESGQKVVLALAGSRLIDGHSEGKRWMTLKPGSIRGVRSEAMVCSEKELGISEEHEGILVLPDDAPVGTPLQDYLGDTVLSIGVTPNFARALSVLGLAREVAALIGQTPREEEPTMLETGAPAAGQVEVEIADPDLCARYCATVIRGITVGSSPAWMQRRLALCGVRPINNVVDITNYVMLELGQPLHAFDYDLLHGRGGDRPPAEPPLIRVRRARSGERMATLDGQERDLDPDVLLITDGAGPVAIAGVMGGLESEISQGTRNVLLEAASFDLIGNRVASQKLHLASEASYRFGRGVPPSLADAASRRAAELLRLLAGGEIQRGIVQDYPVPQPLVSVALDPRRARTVLGLDISDDDLERILISLAFGVERREPEWQVRVPKHRLDVSLPEDLYEEVARVYGYDRLPGTLLRDELPPQRDDPARRAEDSVRDTLVAAGLQEVVTYSLTDWRLEAPLRQTDIAETDYLRVLNPLSADRQWLRRSLLPGLLVMARDNCRVADSVTVFEIGQVFIPMPGEELPAEPLKLALVMGGAREQVFWEQPEAEELDFVDAKGLLEELAERAGVALRFEAARRPGLHPGRTANVVLEGAGEIGYLGELHPEVRATYELPDRRFCVCELELGRLLSAWVEDVRLDAPSRFPAVIQDMALILPRAVTAAAVVEHIRRAGGGILASATLFDVYEGEGIPDGERSLAFHLVYQVPDRTLTDREVQRVHERIAQKLGSELAAKLRE